jgi:hypothetical protein
MTPENFTYWLQGFFEVSDTKKLDEKQVQIIKDHLNLVFNKVTPNRDGIQMGSTLQGGSTVDLLPKTYCATTTFDLSSLNKKVC